MGHFRPLRYWGGNGSHLASPPPRGTISFGIAIKGAVRHGYMGNPLTVALGEQDTTYHTPCLCLLCGRGSRPWMREPRRQIHPAPSTTITDIPHQSHHIRWPCLLFCVSLSHTVWYGSCSIWYLQLRPDVGSCVAPEHLSESKGHCRSCTRAKYTDKQRCWVEGVGHHVSSLVCKHLVLWSLPVCVCYSLAEQNCFVFFSFCVWFQLVCVYETWESSIENIGRGEDVWG